MTKVKLLIYILAYSDETYRLASIEYGIFNWAKVIRIPSSILFENVIFDSILEERKEEWMHLEYVGFLSWKASSKIRIHSNMKTHIGKIVKDVRYDVIGLYDPFPNKSFIEQACRCHPKFYHIWEPLMTSLGYKSAYNFKEIRNVFLANYWIAKPEWLQKYLAFFKKLKMMMSTLESIQMDLWEDSKYPCKSKALQSHLYSFSGKPYYTYHPFIFERVPAVFFFFEGANVIVTREGPKNKERRKQINLD